MNLDEMQALVAVLDEGNFVRASEALGVPRATLRRRISCLEEQVGKPLLHRGRLETTATEAGAVLADGARALLNEAQALMTATRSAGDEPAGVVRMGLPTGLPPQVMSLFFSTFRAKFPEVLVEIRFFDDPRQRILDEVDLAVHIGGDAIDGPWLTYELGQLEEQLAACPEYLEQRGTPGTLADLAEHDLLTLYAPGSHPGDLPLLDGGVFRVSPILASTDPRTVQEFAEVGLGIAMCVKTPFPGFPTTLVPVLTDVVGKTTSMRMIVPRTLVKTPLLRAIFRFAKATFGRDLVAERSSGGSP